jgi:hypothetical protein
LSYSTAGLFLRAAWRISEAVFCPRRFKDRFSRRREARVVNIQPTEPKPELQANKLALMRKLDAGVLDRLGHVDQLESAIANYELAFRMQSAVPELMEISGESGTTRNLYG